MQGQLRAGPLDWREFYATVGDADERIGWSFYHRKTYKSGITTTLNFFDDVPDDPAFGNMPSAKQLPDRVHFAIAAIRVIPVIRPDQRAALSVASEGILLSLADDLAQVLYDGFCELKILNKPYVEAPAIIFNAGTGIEPHHVTVSTTAQASNYASLPTFGRPDPRAVNSLSVPLSIPPQTPFGWKMDWAVAKTLEAGDLDLIIYFDGQIIRPVQ